MKFKKIILLFAIVIAMSTLINGVNAKTVTYDMKSYQATILEKDYEIFSNYKKQHGFVSQLNFYENGQFKAKVLIESKKKVKKANIYYNQAVKNKKGLWNHENKIKTVKMNKNYQYINIGNNCMVTKVTLTY